MISLSFQLTSSRWSGHSFHTLLRLPTQNAPPSLATTGSAFTRTRSATFGFRVLTAGKSILALQLLHCTNAVISSPLLYCRDEKFCKITSDGRRVLDTDRYPYNDDEDVTSTVGPSTTTEMTTSGSLHLIPHADQVGQFDIRK